MQQKTNTQPKRRLRGGNLSTPKKPLTETEADILGEIGALQKRIGML